MGTGAGGGFGLFRGGFGHSGVVWEFRRGARGGVGSRGGRGGGTCGRGQGGWQQKCPLDGENRGIFRFSAVVARFFPGAFRPETFRESVGGVGHLQSGAGGAPQGVLLPKTPPAPPERAGRALRGPRVRGESTREAVVSNITFLKADPRGRRGFGGALGGFVGLGLCRGHPGLGQGHSGLWGIPFKATDQFPPHSPWAWGAPHNQGTPLFPFPEGWALGWGSSRGQRKLGGLPGAPSRVLNPPELPPHPTQADPKTPPGWPRSLRPPRIASLQGNTGCCEGGRQQPLHPGAGRNPKAFPEPELGPAPPRRIREEF